MKTFVVVSFQTISPRGPWKLYEENSTAYLKWSQEKILLL